MGTDMEWHQFQNAEELADRTARYIVDLGCTAISERGRFILALSGGNTPKATYHKLTLTEYRTQLSWNDTFIIWTDERCVPADSEGSNYRMTCEALLNHVPVPADNILRIRGERCPLAEDEHYEQALHRLLGTDDRIDLTLLGVGTDGHTASLFPNAPTLVERQRWVLPATGPAPYAHRITLTLPLINASRNVLVLACGSDKAPIVQAIMSGAAADRNWPILAVQPSSGRLLWYVDQDAAGTG